MLAASAHQCPICTLTSYQCDHELVCWSAGELADCRLAGSIEKLAQVAEQVLARSLSLRVPPTTPELQALYRAWAGVDLDDAELDCLPWVQGIAESWPEIRKTEDECFTILWASDANAVRNRLDDLQRALEIEMCRHPGDLSLVPT